MKAEICFLIFLLFLGAMPANSRAASDTTIAVWREGTHYTVIRPAQPVEPHPVGVEVVEVFSYTCSHCYRFDPILRNWLAGAPKDVEFRRIPSLWSAKHKAHARLFYTLQDLGRNDLDSQVFEEIHARHNPLFSVKDDDTYLMQLKFAQSHGIAESDFSRVYHSAQVDTQLEQAAQLLVRFRIENTPAIVVGGQFMSDAVKLNPESQDEADDLVAFDRLIALTDALVAKERAVLAAGR
jgi:protein dithiol oxidoreductase (disulfide-forming)